MRRIWLGVEAPCLERAADWLLEATAGDLEQTVCVVPGRRSGRTLLADLARRSRGTGTLLIPPQIVTPGAMGDVLLDSRGPLATGDERLQAWVVALRSTPPADLSALVVEPPDHADLTGWTALARTVDRVHEELAGERLGVRDALDRADPREEERWRTLVALHDTAERALRDAGLTDRGRAFEQAIEDGRTRPGVHLVLVGVPELNGRQRAIAGMFESGGDSATLVFANESDQERFDELGCVRPDVWSAIRIVVDDERIVVADRPADQAQAVLDRLSTLNDHHDPGEISIGLGDETLASCLARAGRWAGVAFHDAAGRPLRRTPTHRLLEQLAAWIADRSAPRLAELLRHPDLERFLGGGDAVTSLDRYRRERLPATLDADTLDEQTDLARLVSRLDELLVALSEATRPLATWCDPVLEVLRRVYDETASGGDEPGKSAGAGRTAEACAAFRDTAAALARVHGTLQPTVNGPAALTMLLESAGAVAIAQEPGPEQVEMLGWLEVALDPAPVLIMTGVNDGAVPATVPVDPLLPERLRRALGLRQEERRYARDAYWLDLLVRGGRDVTLIAGRRGVNGDPLAPSRLLLVGEPDRVVSRVRRFCGSDRGPSPALPRGLSAAETSRFGVPQLPAELPLPTSMRVTDFKLYLQCPYRYALRRLLRIERLDDAVDELSPLRFGSLAHEVLEAFGRHEDARDDDDPLVIEAFLHDELHHRGRRLFGAAPLPAVAVQLARLRRRLTAFAYCQSQLRREGWSIRHCELAFKDEPALPVDGGEQMPLRGVIDRIDLHEPTGRWRVIDYKTGEAGDEPVRTHHGAGRAPDTPPARWLDLQLPLYRHLVSAGGPRLEGSIELGYLVLPRQVESVGFRGVRWNDAMLGDAMRQAGEIVRRIRARSFELNHEHAPAFDEFARLCQTGAFGVHEKDDAA